MQETASQHNAIKDEDGNLLNGTTFTIGGTNYTPYKGLSLFVYSGDLVDTLGDKYTDTLYTRGSATSGHLQGSPCNLDLYTKNGTTSKSVNVSVTYTPQGSLYPASGSGQNLYLGSTSISNYSKVYALQSSSTYMYAPKKTFTTGAGNMSAYRADLLYYWNSYSSSFKQISTDSSLMVGCLQTLDTDALVYNFLNSYGFIAGSASQVLIPLYRAGNSTTETKSGTVSVDNYLPYTEDLYYEGDSAYSYTAVSKDLYEKGDTIPAYTTYTGDTLYTASESSDTGKTYTYTPATFTTKTVTAVTKNTEKESST